MTPMVTLHGPHEAVSIMLLNEFQRAPGISERAHGAEQEATIALLKSMVEKQEANAQQQKQIETVTAGLQKVSAQLEASRPAPQVVNLKKQHFTISRHTSPCGGFCFMQRYERNIAD
jgi:uncharacterized coiled-coil protein SlyX